MILVHHVNDYFQYLTELDNIAAICAQGFTCTTTVLDTTSSEGRELKYIEVNRE